MATQQPNNAPPPSPTAIRSRMDMLDPNASKSMEAAEALIAQIANAKGNNKSTKTLARKIISSANQVIAVVEGVAEIHPVTKATVSVFKALIKLELDRQSNNEQIAVVCHSMTSLVYTLRNMTQIFDEDDAFTDSLDDDLWTIAETMKDFGNFANVYYKYKQNTVRVCRSASYQEKLDNFAKTFMQQKQSLAEKLNYRGISTTLTMRNQLTNLNTNIEKVIGMLGDTSVNEQKAAKFIATNGGLHNVVFDDVLLADVAKILGEKLIGPVKTALREDLDFLLTRNLVQFNLKIDGAMTQIAEAVERSKEAILRRLDEGPHELIEDEDVKKVWKDNQWRASVKCRVFVDALHDYFDDQFRNKAHENGFAHPDLWTLDYLSKVKFHAAIGDAIDEDGSGFISVHEANHFLRRRPEGWSVPRWLTFWALGWSGDNMMYYFEIDTLLDDIVSASKSAHSSNKADIEFYLTVLDCVKPILEAGEDDLTDVEWEDELYKLQEKYMKQEQDRIKEMLTQTNFYLEDYSNLAAALSGQSRIQGQDRIELSFMALLYLLLKHHCDVIQEAQKHEIGEEIFFEMCETLTTVFSAFWGRMVDLLQGWKRQRIDVSLQVQSFAGGLYYSGYQESQKPNNVATRLNILMGDGESEEEDESPDEGTPDQIEQLVTRVSSLETQLQKMESMLQSLVNSSCAVNPDGKRGINSEARAPPSHGTPFKVQQAYTDNQPTGYSGQNSDYPPSGEIGDENADDDADGQEDAYRGNEPSDEEQQYAGDEGDDDY